MGDFPVGEPAVDIFQGVSGGKSSPLIPGDSMTVNKLHPQTLQVTLKPLKFVTVSLTIPKRAPAELPG